MTDNQAAVLLVLRKHEVPTIREIADWLRLPRSSVRAAVMALVRQGLAEQAGSATGGGPPSEQSRPTVTDPRYAHCPECAGGRVDCPRCDGEGIVELVERSSLGTPEAKALRESVDPEWAAVLVWLADTYTDEGITLWFANYRRQDDEGKARLRRIALTPDGGT